MAIDIEPEVKAIAERLPAIEKMRAEKTTLETNLADVTVRLAEQEAFIEAERAKIKTKVEKPEDKK